VREWRDRWSRTRKVRKIDAFRTLFTGTAKIFEGTPRLASGIGCHCKTQYCAWYERVPSYYIVILSYDTVIFNPDPRGLRLRDRYRLIEFEVKCRYFISEIPWHIIVMENDVLLSTDRRHFIYRIQENITISVYVPFSLAACSCRDCGIVVTPNCDAINTKALLKCSGNLAR
jgi:hypothetical protein